MPNPGGGRPPQQERSMKNAVVCSAVAAVLGSASGAISGTNQVVNPPEIVVSATRIETPVTEVASSVTVIGRDEIARRGVTTLVDALEAVPGLSMVRTGGPGQLASPFLRGGSPDHTLVLIDGIEINDPSAVGRGASLDILDAAGVERIEVLRGPQSSLYGSDAMAGVINIVTRSGAGKPSASLLLEGGSYNTFTEAATLQGGSNRVHYAASVNRVDSQGISAAGRRYGNGEKDAYHATSAAGRLGFTPAECLGLDVIARYLDSYTQFDAAGGEGGDALGTYGEEQRLFLRTQARVGEADSAWVNNLGVAYTDHDRKSHSAWGDSTFEGQLFKVDWKSDLRVCESHTATLGAEYENERAKADTLSRHTADTLSAYLQDRWTITEPLSLTMGGRVDDYDTFGSAWTYRVAPLYAIESTGTRLRATYGTGFKAPSLYQLYAPATEYGPIGNADLEAEKMEGWDAGVEQVLCPHLTVGATYFENSYRDMIEYGYGFENHARAETRGVEFSSTLRATDALTIRATYTYLDTENKTTGEELIRRPNHRATLDADYAWTACFRTGIGAQYVGNRSDNLYTATMMGPEHVTLDSYTLVNLRASCQVSPRVEVYARVENLLDEKYEEVAGYGTPGLSAYGGVRVALR